MSPVNVLVVDLDHTLIQTDILFESFFECASANTFKLLRVLPRLVAGKAQLKAGLSRLAALDPEKLPYNQEVLDYIRAWRDQGGKTALVTATDQSVASDIAEHLGVFDEVFGSDGVRNLKGPAKASFLVDRYGAGNYDYIGDSAADLPVWASARKAITIGLSNKARGRVQSAEPPEVGDAILKAVNRRRNVVYVRPVWWLVMAIIRSIPEAIFKGTSI